MSIFFDDSIPSDFELVGTPYDFERQEIVLRYGDGKPMLCLWAAKLRSGAYPWSIVPKWAR